MGETVKYMQSCTGHASGRVVKLRHDDPRFGHLVDVEWVLAKGSLLQKRVLARFLRRLTDIERRRE
jgi:hypothetical protein